MFVYLLSHEYPYEGSSFLGIFSTMARAKDEASRMYPRTIVWQGNRKEAWNHEHNLEISKVRVDEIHF